MNNRLRRDIANELSLPASHDQIQNEYRGVLLHKALAALGGPVADSRPMGFTVEPATVMDTDTNIQPDPVVDEGTLTVCEAASTIHTEADVPICP